MSFQATEWSRSLPLHSLSAKFTLMMIASYAGTDDACFPSLARLADDTLQSVATVRRRIRELEDIGVLVRMARWTTPNGQVVITGVGTDTRPAECRQTSDELRLLLSVTPDAVKDRIASLGLGERKSRGDESDADTADESEGRVSICEGGEGVNLQPPGSHMADTPGVSHGSHPLNRNLKIQMNPGLTPDPLATETRSGESGKESFEEGHLGDPERAEAKREFQAIYPLKTNRPDQFDDRWSALSPGEYRRATVGARGLVAWKLRHPKQAIVAPEKFISDAKLWAQYEQYAPKEPEKLFTETLLFPGSESWNALMVAQVIAGLPMPRSERFGDVSGIRFKRALPSGAASLAAFVNANGSVDLNQWMLCRSGSQRCFAWAERASEWTGQRVMSRSIRLQGPPRVERIVETDIERFPMVHGLMVPWTESGFPPPKSARAGPDSQVA